MHTSEGVPTGPNVPAFLTKLWKLVDDPNYDHLIHWSQNGKSFVISDQAQFAKELLPLYFKHNNMASFIRQLNMYGFRKLTNIENGGLRSERDDIEFYHIHFVKDHESSLEFIKRKIKPPLQVSSTQTLNENKTRTDDVGEILLDVKAIRGRQENVDQILINMQKENEALWREIAILRQKHQKQQHMVDKLIQFLLSLVPNRGLGVKRKSPLMIGSTESIACISDESRPKRPANSFDYHSDTSVGPLIFDVTDTLLEDESGKSAYDKSDFNISCENNSTKSQTCNSAKENLIDPLQSVIESSIINDIDDINEPNIEYVLNNQNKSDKGVTIFEVEDENDKIVAQVLKPVNIVNKKNNLNLIPSTSGCTLAETSDSVNSKSFNVNGDNLDISKKSQKTEKEYILNNYFSISEIPSNASSAITSGKGTLKNPDDLNTPETIVIREDLANQKNSFEENEKSTNLSTISSHPLSIENINDHLDTIDLELNWLNEQLSNVEGLSFDPNSLMDLDFEPTNNSH